MKIACIEEIAYNFGYIDKAELQKICNTYKGQPYGEYLTGIIEM